MNVYNRRYAFVSKRNPTSYHFTVGSRGLSNNCFPFSSFQFLVKPIIKNQLQEDLDGTIHSFLNKKLLKKKFVLNFLANYNRNTIGYCSPNNIEQKKNQETFSIGARPKFLIKKLSVRL